MLKKLVSSLKGRIIALVLGIFASIYAIFFYFAADFIDTVEHQLAEKLISQQVQITRERTLHYFDREIKLLEIGVANQAYSTWMKSPDDIFARDVAIENINIICKLVGCYGWFMHSHKTLKGFEYNRTFDEVKEERISTRDKIWYDPLIASGKKVFIDSNVHPTTYVQGVFLDYVVRENDMPLGIVGTYLYLEDITSDLLSSAEKGVTNALIDDRKIIRVNASADPEGKGFFSENFANGQWDRLIPASVQQQLLSRADNQDNRVFTTQLQLRGQNYLAAIMYIEQVEWFAVSLYPLALMQQQFDNLPLLLVSLSILIVFVVLTLYFLNQQIISPVLKLNQVVDAIHQGDYERRVPQVGSDVIKNLGDRINSMAAQIASQFNKLENTNQALHEATERATKANRAKSLFLSNMSHEMRTPLNAVIGFTQFALKTDSEQTRIAHLNRVDSAANHLLQVINDLLDLNKIEMDEFKLEHNPFKLTAVIQKVMCISQVKAQAKNIPICFDMPKGLPKTLIGDPLRIEQILINLLGNATKFTESGEIRLSIRLIKKTENYLVLALSVKDTGIGMTEEQQQKLFKPFSQADDSITRKYGGTGLGLAISKQLAEAMQGNIAVSSELGEGSTFEVCIQLEYSESDIKNNDCANDIPLATLLPVTRGLRVLLVEDNEINQEVAKGMLTPLEISLDVAENGQEAVDMQDQHRYDLILMDIQMPVMDGFCATNLLREKGDKVYVIGLSAHGTKQDRDNAIEAGMDAYQTKPINQQALFKTIFSLLDNSASAGKSA